jgi:hypothetical protein
VADGAGLVALALLPSLLPARLLASAALVDVLIVLALAVTGLGIGMGWPHLVARAAGGATGRGKPDLGGHHHRAVCDGHWRRWPV